MKNIYVERLERYRVGVGWEPIPGRWTIQPATTVESNSIHITGMIVRSTMVAISEPGVSAVYIRPGDRVRNQDGREWRIYGEPGVFKAITPHVELTLASSSTEGITPSPTEVG